jgi:hypothetical protein
LWLLGLSNDWILVVVYCACSELLNKVRNYIMMEITNLMKNTIVLLMTIVVGGAGALLERVQICNLPEVGKKRSSRHKINA